MKKRKLKWRVLLSLLVFGMILIVPKKANAEGNEVEAGNTAVSIENVSVVEGTRPALSVTTPGEDWSCYWEYKYAGSKTWTTWGSGNPFTPQWPAEKAWQGMSYRARVTDAYGRNTYSNVATVKVEAKTPLSITEQPGVVTIKEGTNGIITAKTSGEGLSYVWEYQYANSNSWVRWGTSSGATFRTPYQADPGWQNLKYRYTVTDRLGNRLTSNAGTIQVQARNYGKVTGSVSNITLKEGTKPTLSVAATGDGIKYTWEYKYAGSRTWTTWGSGNPFTPQWPAEKAWQGMSYRARVTDAYGRNACSNVGTITVILHQAPVIATLSPFKVTEGEKVTLSASATSNWVEQSKLTYQWQYKNSQGSWVKWSDLQTFTPDEKAGITLNGRKVRVIVSDGEKSSTSNETYINVRGIKEPVVYTTMKDLNLNEGDSLTLSADADGEGITYTWQYKSPGADWVLWGNGTPMTTRYKADYTWDGIKYRLVVKDQYGNEAYSNEATVNVKIKLRFLSTLQNVTINEGVIATFKANVVGNGLTYTWQYQSPGKSWVNWGSQYQKNPMTTDYKADGSWNGIKYRVIVKDKWGQTVTSEASVKIKPRLVVVLDPGHDSYHTGASYSNLSEQNLTVKIANYCKAELEKYGVGVYLTHASTSCPNGGGSNSADNGCLAVRANYAKNIGANALISIHLNAGPGKGAAVFQQNANYGGLTYTTSSKLANDIEGQLLSLGLSKYGSGAIVRNSENGTIYPDGSLADYYGLLRRAKLNGTPAVIVEHCFLSNPDDRNKYLMSEDGLRSLGVADANGILQAFGLR